MPATAIQPRRAALRNRDRSPLAVSPAFGRAGYPGTLIETAFAASFAVALLLFFWCHSILNSEARSPARYRFSAASSLEHLSDSGPTASCRMEPLGRRLGRRSNFPPASDGPLQALTTAALISVPKPDSSLLGSPASPLGLEKLWQFRWRTALEPRAPSFRS